MARVSTKENKNVYQLTREGLKLSREAASELLESIPPERIEKIENERSLPHPDEVLVMSDKYKQPSLCNYYCANQCPIGQEYVPEIKVKDLSQIVLEMLASLNSMGKQKDRLIEITAAQGNAAGFHHMLGTGLGIGRMVLVITVHGNDTHTLRSVLQEPVEGIFQSGTLAFVHFMVQQVNHVRVSSGFLFEVVKIFGLAAVVDQNDVGKTVFQQAVNDQMELFIGVQRREDHGNFRKIVHMNTSI